MKTPTELLIQCFDVLDQNGFHVEASQMREHVKRGARTDAQAMTILHGFEKILRGPAEQEMEKEPEAAAPAAATTE